MKFGESRRRKKKQMKVFQWIGSLIKKLKNFCSLEYTLSANNGDTIYAKGQAEALLGRTCSIRQKIMHKLLGMRNESPQNFN